MMFAVQLRRWMYVPRVHVSYGPPRDMGGYWLAGFPRIVIEPRT